MTTNGVPHPPIVSRRQWLNERKKLLAHEKELTKQYDRVNAERQQDFETRRRGGRKSRPMDRLGSCAEPALENRRSEAGATDCGLARSRLCRR